MSNYYGKSLNPDTDAGEAPLIVGRGWSQRGGATVTIQWKGHPTRIAAVEAAQRLLKRETYVEMPDDGGPWVLRAITPQDDTRTQSEIDQPIIDKWSMPGEEVEIEIWELPFIQTEFDKVKDSETESAFAKINFVRTAIEAFVSGSREIEEFNGDTKTPLNEGFLKGVVEKFEMDWAPFKRLLSIRARGTGSKWLSVYVLRHTRIYEDGANFKIEEYGDILQSLTTSQLKQREKIPDTLKFLLPGGSWIKKTPTVEQDDTPQRNWHFVEEWLFVTGAGAIADLYEQVK